MDFDNSHSRLLRIHLEDGRLLEMDHDNIPDSTALISQPEDICLPVMTFLPSRFRPKWSPCSPSTSPCWSIVPSLCFLGFTLSPSPSNTFPSSLHVVFYLRPREILQLTGDCIVFEVCWLQASLWLEKQLTGIT